MKKLSLFVVVALTVALCLTLFACADKTTETYLIPDDLTVNVEIYDGETLLGTVTKDTLKELTQEKISMTTTNDYETTKTSVYVAYSVKAAAEKLGITLPSTITSVKAFATDDYVTVYQITTLDNAYLSIGFEDDGAFAADEKGPRFISDKNSGSANSVAKFIAKIVLNPAAEVEDEDEDGDGGEEQKETILAYTLTPTWSDGGRTLSIVFEDLTSDKTNTIVLSTPEGEGAFTSLTIDDKAPVELTENLLIDHNNKGTMFYGYALDDIIAKMGKFKSGGSWMSFVEAYVRVAFVCTDDNAEADYTARAYTQAEVEGETVIKVVFDAGAAEEEGKTRIYSDLSDTDPATYRNKLKMVSVIHIYAEVVVED